MARKRVEDIIVEAQDATFRLENKPETTLEFVDYLSFLDSFVEKVDAIDEMGDNIKELYSLIKTYNVPTSPEDFAIFQVEIFCLVWNFFPF